MADDEKYFRELGRYTKTNSVLVIGTNGLYRLYCPFSVKVIVEIDVYLVGETLTVERVKTAKNLLLVYEISHRNYYYYYFVII